jgi:hypothetical protein
MPIKTALATPPKRLQPTTDPVGGSQAYGVKRGFALLPRRWMVERAFACPHTFAGSPETTKASPRRSLDTATSPSHAHAS